MAMLTANCLYRLSWVRPDVPGWAPMVLGFLCRYCIIVNGKGCIVWEVRRCVEIPRFYKCNLVQSILRFSRCCNQTHHIHPACQIYVEIVSIPIPLSSGSSPSSRNTCFVVRKNRSIVSCVLTRRFSLQVWTTDAIMAPHLFYV